MTLTRPFSLAILILLGAGVSPSASAGIRVSGAGETVRLEAQDVTLAEALAALGAAIVLRYRHSTALNHRVSGVYVGSLEGVVSRLLQGNDFIIKKSPAGVEVILIVDSAATVAQGPIFRQPDLQIPNAAQPRPPWLR